MNESKMSSSEVPAKFAAWLLAMGCPSEKIPSKEKVAQMCRGQYYMVWRCLMEHVDSKDVIRLKRLQVFHDDLRRCQQAHSQHDDSVLVPREVSSWRERQELQRRVAGAEERVAAARDKLDRAMDKVSGKLAQRQQSRRREADAKRRWWLLQTLAEEQRKKTQGLMETRAIADALCRRGGEAHDIKAKLDQCLSSRHRQSVSPLNPPVASSSMVSSYGDAADYCVSSEEHLSALAECPAHELWRELRVRRAALIDALSTADTSRPKDNTVTPQCIVARTAALHCQLSLESTKHKLQIKQTRTRLADNIASFNDLLTNEDSYELLVLRCEQARSEARVTSLKQQLTDVTSRRGVFAPAHGEPVSGRGTAARGHHLHRALITKKDDVRKLLSALTKTERKIQTVKDSLTNIFNGFQKDLDDGQHYRGGIQLDLPSDAVTSVRQMYRERLARRVVERSLLLDGSAGSLGDNHAENSAEPTFTDELRFYLNNFCLEKNRKLVLESGDKIWISETLQSSVERLQARCLADDVTCTVICPSLGLRQSLQTLCDVTEHRQYLETVAKALEEGREMPCAIDITYMKAAEEEQNDRIKKRLNENILSLQKTARTLESGQENLKLWSQNHHRKHISTNRTVGGKTYGEYEAMYLESLNHAA